MKGWCEECEKEGKDPQHSRTTSLCSRHYEQKRTRLNGKQIYQRRKKQRKNKGWCPQCEVEGLNPVHSRTTILCGMHHQRKYAQTEHGKQKRDEAIRRYSLKRSPIKLAIHGDQEQ